MKGLGVAEINVQPNQSKLTVIGYVDLNKVPRAYDKKAVPEYLASMQEDPEASSMWQPSCVYTNLAMSAYI
ncbi:hypothetical protein FNV43_RR18443 [Rhamnella rubrinervis]|uniref:Uncharacterized protein n=1 Tax=Rhamnella rubrinervis TaxID=2594499 RepID=A0A8K0E6A6_9ROSA|nr:hypothetical protein FNV43_RR18443 [Rhamnella rubrinervis]